MIYQNYHELYTKELSPFFATEEEAEPVAVCIDGMWVCLFRDDELLTIATQQQKGEEQ